MIVACCASTHRLTSSARTRVFGLKAYRAPVCSSGHCGDRHVATSAHAGVLIALASGEAIRTTRALQSQLCLCHNPAAAVGVGGTTFFTSSRASKSAAEVVPPLPPVLLASLPLPLPPLQSAAAATAATAAAATAAAEATAATTTAAPTPALGTAAAAAAAVQQQ